MTNDPPLDHYESGGDEPLMVVGKTGKTGDAGKMGRTGETGRTGKAGNAGLAGAQGRPGRNAVFGTGRILSLFGFIVVAFLVLAVRSEVNSDDIAKNSLATKRQVYAMCVVSQENGESLTLLLDQAIQSIATSDQLTPELKKKYTVLYIRAKPQIVSCGRQP